MAPTPRKSMPKPAASTEDSIGTEPIASAEPFTAAAEPFAELASQAAEASVSKVAEIHESVRKAAEQGLEQTRTAYDRFRAVTEETTGSFETSYAAAAKGLHEFNAKAIDALKSNADATFELMKSLMNVTTVSEAITLQTEHARKQFEALTAQTKELAEIAKKVATETAEPLKTSVVKTFGKAA
jgi:phasin